MILSSPLSRLDMEIIPRSMDIPCAHYIYKILIISLGCWVSQASTFSLTSLDLHWYFNSSFLEKSSLLFYYDQTPWTGTATELWHPHLACDQLEIRDQSPLCPDFYFFYFAPSTLVAITPPSHLSSTRLWLYPFVRQRILDKGSWTRRDGWRHKTKEKPYGDRLGHRTWGSATHCA